MVACVIGLGYVGLTLAVHIASRKMCVHGVEMNPTILDSLKKGKPHFFEAGLDEKLGYVLEKKFFTFSEEIPTFNEQVVYLITVGTPLFDNGRINMNSIIDVAKNLSRKLKDEDIVILRSTVKVGTTRNIVKPILDESGKKYYLGFCPERTIEGKAIDELYNLPQIISGIDEKSKEKILDFFKKITKEQIVVNSVEAAELAKLINNAERDTLFAMANELALLCHSLHIDVYDVIKACTFNYKRSYLKKPGPVGGPCLTKDTWILAKSFEGKKYVPKLFTNGREVNESLIYNALSDLIDYLNQKKHKITKVAILGFAFKGDPPTSDLRGSTVSDVIKFFRRKIPNIKIIGHDYLVNPKEAYAMFGVKLFNDFKQAVCNVDLIILHTNHPSYSKEDWSIIGNAFVFDFWKQLIPEKVGLNLNRYLYLGGLYK